MRYTQERNFARAPFHRTSRVAASNCRSSHMKSVAAVCGRRQFQRWKDMIRRSTSEAQSGGTHASRRNGPSAEAVHERCDLRFIDAHSERNRGSDHAYVIAQKCILMPCALGIC